MHDSHENQARFIHLFSSPLTAMRGAIDLLRRRNQGSDPVTRELVETLERSSARLRRVVEILLTHNKIVDGTLEIKVPLGTFWDELDQPTDSAEAPVRSPVVPLEQVPAAPAGAAAITLGTPSHAGTILVVEESPTHRILVRSALQHAGYAVLEATSAVEAVDMARQHHPDLILLDIDLPQLSGHQVAQVLHEDPETKTIPLVYSSRHGRPAMKLPAYVELLPKNVELGTLLTTIQQTIAAAQARAEQSPSLLIVDDDLDIQRVLSLMLQQEGYRVVSASLGAEALVHTQKQPFDLIILDLLLPDIDGFSVLGALRARPATALTPIILLSARDTAQEKVHGLQLGADDYVTKPFSPAELQARVRSALRRRELATGANPSTRLPGNIAIEQAIRRRIENNLPFAVCYSDLDNFKAYNDTYGFLKGDAIIQQTAHVLVSAVEQHGNSDDFVGHIGGDDFVVITTPDLAEPICASAIANFDMLVPLFYDHDTRQRGYIDATDRQGRPTRFPLVTISIGIVSNARRPIRHLAEVAQRSVEPKKRAKEIEGSVFVLEDCP